MRQGGQPGQEREASAGETKKFSLGKTEAIAGKTGRSVRVRQGGQPGLGREVSTGKTGRPA
jgi:hypothetical protein